MYPVRMSLLAHFQRLHAYEVEASRLVIASLRSAAAAAGNGGVELGAIAHGKRAHARAVEVFGHIQSARHVWLWRLGAAEQKPFVMWPGYSIDEAERDAQTLDGRWGAYLAGLKEQELTGDVRYSSLDGSGFISTVGEILTHVFNHSTYHRGQISMLVNAAGGARAATDFIVLSRRKQ